MERKLILRGLLAGGAGGLAAFGFARIFAEPQIQAAIAYESGRDADQPPEPDLFSRTLQANVGLGVGMILFGVAMGAVFAVAYTICLGRVGRIRPRTLAMLIAAGGFLGFYFVPFLKYPANPPAIGHEETIRTRANLYLVMVVCSLLFLIAAVALGKLLRPRFGNWNATLLALAAYVVLIGAVMAVLPSLGHLAANVQEYGRHATETPLPLTDSHGTIVYPGFDADRLYAFRLYSVGAQLLLWGVIGTVFAPLADRLLRTPVQVAV
ncbi:CbtA family protein [Kribbella sp. GL6]|uniref:CbtA family protein n=1 Tax=Kribbella sp. GL6 TaxID=3419765 RepID=UPI003D084EF1